MSKITSRQTAQLTSIIYAMRMQKDEQDIVFERFLFLLAKLEEEEIDLIIDLTKRFQKLGTTDYFRLLPLARNMAATRGSFKKIIVSPLKKIAKPSKDVETDSSCCLYYQ